jgi:translation initiation factor 3 subunit D
MPTTLYIRYSYTLGEENYNRGETRPPPLSTACVYLYFHVRIRRLSVFIGVLQRGAILANELKNNSCKLARWTAQALLGGVDEMKLGYVSRSNFKDPYSHVVLGVQSYNPNTFATQMALNQNNTWGIIKMLSELLLEQPEGKYVVMKDPNKPILRLFSVPLDTFEEEGEEDEEDDE